ncbi:hypothetical protein DICPUDRAFT_35593 [Dictyostelium purpureum]|uniref:CRAL-TRIO domain-containing protein n=1 Tax=Dictyostelium purpureum TaxID=5786 RepID=F0ZPJ2_DICPU|nr:uncharacterized protein DICPUDRAFT_35593 [Dictyostelium purpureum]EGC34131.1 hypothetical protein DICPUDRAFT_35593 [Dictyostelium purpureum]|eukprot:XP_003289329.1 hypothetical protein DICPUDRAFT_35593 [Dictyostelium purpureum]
MEIFKKFKQRIEKEILDESSKVGEKEKKWLSDDIDMMLLRYLRARDYEAEASYQLLKGTIEWRSTYRPYDIAAEDLSYEASTGKQYVFGKSHGRSCIYMRPTRENTKNYEKQIKLLVYNIERAVSLMDKSKGHEQIVLLIDFNGYSIMNSPPMHVAKLTLQILSDHYPERLGNAFLVDTPLIFSVFWKAITPLVNKVTYKKIVFANGEKQKVKVFSEYFDLDELEKEFTGNCDHTFDPKVDWKREIELSRKERNLEMIPDEEILTLINTKV